MSFESERFIAGNVPTMKQLDRLADVWRQSAEERQVLKDCQVGVAEHYTRDILEAPVEINGELVVLQHVIGVQMGRHPRVDDSYNTVQVLEYHDSLRLPNRDVARAAIRYAFIWNEDKVIRARRTVSTVRLQDALTPEDAMSRSLDHFSLDDSVITILGAEVNFSEVTVDDCERLIAEATAYYALLDTVGRHHI